MSTRICALDDIPADGAIRIDITEGGVEHRLAVVRLTCDGTDDVYVIGDRCTHADFSLSEGEVDCDDKTIECWKHGALFSLESGEPSTLPATKPTPTYAVSLVDGDVHVDLSSGEAAA